MQYIVMQYCNPVYCARCAHVQSHRQKVGTLTHLTCSLGILSTDMSLFTITEKLDIWVLHKKGTNSTEGWQERHYKKADLFPLTNTTTTKPGFPGYLCKIWQYVLKSEPYSECKEKPSRLEKVTKNSDSIVKRKQDALPQIAQQAT